MPIYISMLRGINVGGHKLVKMDRLRTSFEALGFSQVRTYIQSGNVVYKSGSTSGAQLSKKIEARILADFGFPVRVITRTQAEFRKVVAQNPFASDRAIDQTKLHVTFLSDAPGAAGLKKLAKLTVAPEQTCCVGKEVYLYLPNGVGESRLMKSPWEKELLVGTTTRNWKTVNTLHHMCMDCK
jgi:uncharacterized protein (DUF1697 family)